MILSFWFSKIESEKESVMIYKVLAEDIDLGLNYSTGINGLLVELDKKMFSKVINNLLVMPLNILNKVQ
jgi:hypothetical protein